MNKEIIKDIFIVVILITTIVLRWFCHLDDNIISLVNALGMVISLVSTTITLTINLKQRFVVYGALIIVVEVIGSAIFLGALLFNALRLSARVNDTITILALLFSIPTELYKKMEIVFGIAKK